MMFDQLHVLSLLTFISQLMYELTISRDNRTVRYFLVLQRTQLADRRVGFEIQ